MITRSVVLFATLLVALPASAQDPFEEATRATAASCPEFLTQERLPACVLALQRQVLQLQSIVQDRGRRIAAHMGTAAGTSVVGLYAATNPARSGPYLSRQWCVDKYDLAARRLLGKSAVDLPWTTKIERPGVMDLITPDDVTKKLHSVLVALARKR